MPNNHPIEHEIEKIQQEAIEVGVLLECSVIDDEEIIWLERIERHAAPPGAGAQMLSALMEIADNWDWQIAGVVEHGSEHLKRYYQQLGFSIENDHQERTIIRT